MATKRDKEGAREQILLLSVKHKIEVKGEQAGAAACPDYNSLHNQVQLGAHAIASFFWPLSVIMLDKRAKSLAH